ncbi:hypothetical protein DFH94DRAFT_693312 [Russula ochroleuca]|uniref:Uncharacterized protein n=1 Tax=Russula ochroleuca TaxID=152965 RepID=A0A9P5T7H7_9AGAM|nr:hypothetical protein DFH94DRAFT_693312 [Russula ochroleuca]
MELSANISPTIALAGILSGIFLFALSMLLFHILLQRRRARPHNHQHASSSSSRRRSHRTQSDSESDLASCEDVDEEKEKEGEREKTNSSRASSLNLEPNRPLYVDVESESERGPHSALQFILTPPTPGR